MIRLHLVTAALVAIGLGAPASAQDKAAPPASTAPSPAESSPLPTTTAPDPASKPGGGAANPTPDKALGPPAAPGAAPSASPSAPARQTLVPDPADSNDVDEVTLPAKPAAILSGKTRKEGTVAELKSSFKRIEDALAKAGITPTGRPLAVFTNIEDDDLQYEAMIPIASPPTAPPTDTGGIRFGTTPSGKGYRFKHSGSYDEIYGTYEVLSAYLDVKDIVVQDPFIEEYVTDLTDGADDKLDVNIYALRK